MIAYQMPFPVPMVKFKSTISVDTRDLLTILTTDLCEFFRVDPDMLKTHSKESDVKYVRWLVWKVMYSQRLSYAACGKLWGHNYDHTTVRHALNQLPDDIEKMPKVRAAYMLIIHHDNDRIESCQ